MPAESIHAHVARRLRKRLMAEPEKADRFGDGNHWQVNVEKDDLDPSGVLSLPGLIPGKDTTAGTGAGMQLTQDWDSTRGA